MAEIPTTLMEEQHGLVTTEQLHASSFTEDEIAWLVTSQRVVQVSPRLFRLAGAPQTKTQRTLAAVLDAGSGSALSHTSALAWWGLPGFPLDEIHVTHARDGVHRARRLADHVHDVVLLPNHHTRVFEGVPVVSPTRALFDIAGLPRMHPARLERAVDNAWSQRLVSGRSLNAMLKELAKRGRPGISLMREILAERGPDYVPPASGLEARVIEILRSPLIPPLRRQVDTGDDETWIGRIDFAGETVPFRLEVQSERYHSSLLDSRSDADRLSRLEAAGFVVATVTDLDVWHRPHRVREVVQVGLREAQQRRSSVLAPETRGSPRVSGARTTSAA